MSPHETIRPLRPSCALTSLGVSLRSTAAASVAAWLLLLAVPGCQTKPMGVTPGAPAPTRVKTEPAPFFEIWEEENVFGVLEVAMDGTVLMISHQGDPHPDKRRGGKIYLKRSEDGGTTWSEHEHIGDSIALDQAALGIGPYDGKGWGNDKHHGLAHLGTSVVDETTGEIMFFITALHPALQMYKSRDNGKTWSLESIEMKKDSRGFLSVPNGACDPGITIKHGPHKGRLLVPSRVMPNYRKHDENKGYTCAVYSDDHGKTWELSEPFPLDGTGESGLVELSDGTIYINSRTHTRKGNRWVAYSDDSGETWRDLHQDDELFDGPPDVYGCKAALLRIERDDRDILLFSSPTPHLPGRKNIRVWVSFDGGKTWPHNRLIRRGPGNYTWLTQGRKGTPSEGFIYLLSGKDWMARFNLAWLLEPVPPKLVLGKRPRYGFSDSDVHESSENAELFESSDPKFEKRPRGYRLRSGSEKGSVRTHPLILPSGKMKVSCRAKNGRLMVVLMDESDTKLRDSHWITGVHLEEPIAWQDGPITEWVGKELYVDLVLEGDAEIFSVSFDDVPDTETVSRTIDSTAGLTPSDEDFVLPPRNDYVAGQTTPFVKSVENAERIDIEDARLEMIKVGYRSKDPSVACHVVSHKFSLPSSQMKITCDVSSGSIRVSLFGPDGTLINTSKPVTGGLKIRTPLEWPAGLELDSLVSTPIAVRFDLEGDAKLFALRFDDLFWE